MLGTTLEDACYAMSWSAKRKLIDKTVNFSAQLFRLRAPSIGNTYRSADTADIPNDLQCPAIPENKVGRIVSMPFFRNDHLSLNIPRGPFSTSREWLAASLAIKKYDYDRIAQQHRAREADWRS
ncbi:hypothetical protein ABVK25_008167 [Lepraria finkii]|uniref:Uncharacterized protein n=1 Tax=Lepraria finkii TaxID=1340010 RepID=A0ABR4B1A1_9LECA